MFKLNRDIYDLADLLQAVAAEVETLGRLVNAQNADITACNGYWNLKIRYGAEEIHYFTQDYETLEELRDDVSKLSAGAKMAAWKEV